MENDLFPIDPNKVDNFKVTRERRRVIVSFNKGITPFRMYIYNKQEVEYVEFINLFKGTFIGFFMSLIFLGVFSLL